MGKAIKARIQWLPTNQGGRKALPSELRYSTVAYFAAAAGDWPHTAWSIIADFSELPRLGIDTIATIRFLATEAPVELLELGNRFELMEGERVVARGEVIG